MQQAVVTRPPTAVFLAFAPVAARELVDPVLTSRSGDTTLEVRIYAIVIRYLLPPDRAAQKRHLNAAVNVSHCQMERENFVTGSA
jgi:hypothetical protein